MIDHSKGLRNVKKHIYRQKASDAFAAVTTVSVAIVGVMSYVQMSNTIENDAIAKVIAVEETMGHALDDQFHLIDADLRVLGNFNQTRDALVRLNAGFENLRKEGRTLHAIYKMPI